MSRSSVYLSTPPAPASKQTEAAQQVGMEHHQAGDPNSAKGCSMPNNVTLGNKDRGEAEFEEASHLLLGKLLGNGLPLGGGE